MDAIEKGQILRHVQQGSLCSIGTFYFESSTKYRPKDKFPKACFWYTFGKDINIKSRVEHQRVHPYFKAYFNLWKLLSIWSYFEGQFRPVWSVAKIWTRRRRRHRRRMHKPLYKVVHFLGGKTELRLYYPKGIGIDQYLLQRTLT